MLATVLVTFIDRSKSKRYDSGDVVSISKVDFERINKYGNYLKEGRHRFGSGICRPCQKRKT